jgi:hypothetical protein
MVTRQSDRLPSSAQVEGRRNVPASNDLASSCPIARIFELHRQFSGQPFLRGMLTPPLRDSALP